MSNTFKLRSNNLVHLNEVLQKLAISEGVKIIKNPMLEADGKFMSVINTDSDFNHNIIQGVDVEEEENEKILEKKASLIDEVESKLKQALKNNDEINKLLKKIDNINSEVKDNEWVLNDKGNTALLKDKNAEIFKQNNNLCLSVNNNVHLFGSVRDLHEWLIKHNFPVPKKIQLTETILKRSKDRVDLDRQSEEIKQIVNRIKELKNLMNQNNMSDTNILLSSVFNNDDTLKQEIQNKIELDDLDNQEDQVEECACTTTGDLGMATQYLANKKEEATLNEYWTAPSSFNLVDDKGAQIKFNNIIDGTRAILSALFKDTAFALNDNNEIEMTKDEFERWKQLTSDMDFVITFAIPVMCQKKANDYVNESIEKGNKTGIDPVKFANVVKQNVNNIFNYSLSDEELTAMLKRNSKAKKGRDDLDPSMFRTEAEENLVNNAKKAMGQARANRKEIVDEIFNSLSKEGRIGYGKYKKFSQLMNSDAIKIVKSHDPVNNVVTNTQKPTTKANKSPSEVIYNTLLSGNREKAKELISALDPKTKETVKSELIAMNPNIERFITPMFGESIEENSIGKAFLKSMGV